MTCYCKECSWVGEPIDNSIEGQEHIHLNCRHCGSTKLQLLKPDHDESIKTGETRCEET